ncbi:MAG TPA: gamma-glutamyl-gamma-aminobutyrate hydrolase family protein [Candidatus Udaeobacter sp.]|jgi:putative glutamine amidotransferase|nr:gamma-glutamyl-gamma-aminobutyrate hydrolase family protein [Candidatus Udaeobacter sp.]
MPIGKSQIRVMPNLATWIRQKDAKAFRTIFATHPDIKVWNARTRKVPLDRMDGLLLSGGSDISPEFLRQEVPDPSVLDKQIDLDRDRWEFQAVQNALSRGLPILAICKGLQVFNVALGGTLKLDITGHNLADQKHRDVQPLRNARKASHRFPKVNSAHHQAIDRLGDDLEVEAWAAHDGIIEQVRLRKYPFALGVQYHPERSGIYDSLFEDFFARLETAKR